MSVPRCAALLLSLSAFSLTVGCGGEANAAPLDYADTGSWAYFSEGSGKDADLFLIAPTVYKGSAPNMPAADKKLRQKFIGALNMERGIFEDTARMYAPYYAQASLELVQMTQEAQEACLRTAYEDVSAAFSYYLAHENGGRPIILAGFSQGANMCYRLLEEYFGDPVRSDQLIAVYALGWSCTEDMVQKYPQIKPAQSADDLGTVISFDCEAPEVTETFITPRGVKAYAINPLNWKTDGTPADRSLNTGACFTTQSGAVQSEIPQLCGCYLDEARGVLKVTDIQPTDYPPQIDGFPKGAYHIYDYQFFFRNLQENVRVRTNAYLAAHQQKAASLSDSADALRSCA